MMSIVLAATALYGISEYWRVVNTLSIILLPSLLWLYLQLLEKKQLSFGITVTWLSVFIAFCVSFIVGIFIDIAFYIAWAERIVSGLLFVFFTVIVFKSKKARSVETGSVSAFIFSGGRTNPVMVQEMMAVWVYAAVLFVDYSHWGVAGVTEAVLLSYFAIMGLFGEIEEISTRDISNAFSGKSTFQVNVRQYSHATDLAKNSRLASYNNTESYDDYAMDYSIPEPEPEPEPLPEPQPQADTSLKEKFESEFVEGKLYLISGLTLSDLAGKLETNKTYLSRFVNAEYGKSFTEILVEKRVEYAKDYLVKNPYTSQAIAAQICGFPSPQSFNITFKKVTGMTPKAWIRAAQQ